ncbi:MAG: hypothetical protein J6A25_03575 [Lachnospiraceae bacterium]|nr:hypothetical protein [Lachnospiraceae bacterium]
MKIEILYPQLCCLYGDKGNTMFLQQCLPDAEFIFTGLNEKPAFLSQEIDLCCMYSASEQNQELILGRMLEWKDEISEVCKSGKTLFLLLGNAMELFGTYIQREDESKIDGLGVFNTYTLRHAPKRFNTLIMSQFEGMDLLGYTSRFSDTFGISEDIAMSKVILGTGSDGKNNLEGIRCGRVIGTYMLGPLLVSNPDFTKWLFKELNINDYELPFEEDLYKSYEVRRKEFQRPDLVMD